MVTHPVRYGARRHVVADLMFQLVSTRHEQRSTIITTNVGIGGWSNMFADDKLAAAAIDRVVHHGHLVEFSGTSRHMDESLMLGKDKEE